MIHIVSILGGARAIRECGGFGAIIGRNALQRQKPDALRLLAEIGAILK